MNQPSQSLKYRPDIDGLRAIAVLGVVLFHLFPHLVSGGFVGVDVFFVISGYLISGIIFRGFSSESFSFSEFYGRRVRRIFPALILVLSTALSVGWLILLPDEYAQLGRHVVAAAAFGLNFVLEQEVGYFDVAADSKALLHLWSLGVEEQFYLVWPLLVGLLCRKGRRLGVLVLAGGTVSLAMALWMVQAEPGRVFYLPWYRFWELLAGAGVAWRALARAKEPQGRLAALDTPLMQAGAGALGLMAVLAAMLGFSAGAEYPDARALAPVVGSAMVIHAGPSAWLNRRVLSTPVLVGVGVISYPLYLWHWPLLSFARISEGRLPSMPLRWGVGAVSLALAALTYRWVERRFRVGRDGRSRVLVLIALMLVVLACGAGIWGTDGVAARAVATDSTDLKTAFDGGDQGFSGECAGVKPAGLEKGPCLRDRRGNVRYLVLGDSKAAALYPGLVRTSAPSGRWMLLGMAGITPEEPPTLSGTPESPDQSWTMNGAFSDAMADKSIEGVALVLSARGLYQVSDRVQGPGGSTYDPSYLDRVYEVSSRVREPPVLAGLVGVLVRSGKKVVLVVDNPALPSPNYCARRVTPFSLVSTPVNPRCWVPIERFSQQISHYHAMLQRLQASHANSVRVFDPTGLYCDTTQGACGPTRDGRVMYSYSDHISDYAAGLVGRELNALWTNW